MALAEIKVTNMRRNVYSFITNFLNKKEINSTNTSSDYENDIRQFFWMVKHRHIEMLTEQDLILTNEDVENYQVMLATNKNDEINKGKPYAPKSIARKISSVKALYHKLEASNYPVKEAWFNVDKIKGESESYGVLTWEEVQEMMKIAENEVKGDIKSALLETAVVTCFRQTSLLNLTWNNIEKIDGVWVLCAEDDAIGKGKKSSKKPINDDLYAKLMNIKEKYGEKRIFPLQKKTVTLMMQRYRKALGLDDDIVFHSLKKCGINEAYELTGGDIMAVAEQGDHDSFGTTMKYYMKKKKKFSDMVGLKIGQKIDLTKLDNLSKDELVKVIELCSRSTQLEIINKIKS